MDFSQDYTKKSLSEVAVTFIKNKILAGEFKSGDKLVESEISSELDISRAPVREAMRQLNVEGMISFSPRRGNYVLDMTLDDTMEVFDIRLTLEKQIIERLIREKMLTEEHFSYLRDVTKKMREQQQASLHEHDMLFWLNTLDLKFHGYLWEVSGSRQRMKFLEGLFYQLLIVMNRATITLGTFEEKAQEHLRIVEALQNNDLEQAYKELDSHIGVYVDSVMQIFNE